MNRNARTVTLLAALVIISLHQEATATEPVVETYIGISTRVVPAASSTIPDRTLFATKLVFDRDNNRITETAYRQPVGGDRPEYDPTFRTQTFEVRFVLSSIDADGAVFQVESGPYSGNINLFGAPWAWDRWEFDLTAFLPGVPFPFPVVGTVDRTGSGVDLVQSVMNPFTGEPVLSFESHAAHVNVDAWQALADHIASNIP